MDHYNTPNKVAETNISAEKNTHKQNQAMQQKQNKLSSHLVKYLFKNMTKSEISCVKFSHKYLQIPENPQQSISSCGYWEGV